MVKKNGFAGLKTGIIIRDIKKPLSEHRHK